jgi:hypothetical protein
MRRHLYEFYLLEFIYLFIYGVFYESGEIKSTLRWPSMRDRLKYMNKLILCQLKQRGVPYWLLMSLIPLRVWRGG